MYKLHIDGGEIWDDDKEEFFNVKGFDGFLEHSLVSVSKWEAKYKKPFLSSDKTGLELIDYIRMMVVGEPMEDPMSVFLLTEQQIKEIGEYMDDPMTATVFSKEEEDKLEKEGYSNKFVSSEEMYYWMTAQNIPIECENWHLNRFITLVRICAIKNKPKDKKKKKMTAEELIKRRSQMEEARKKFGGGKK